MKVLRFLAYLCAFLSLPISLVMVYLWCRDTASPKAVSLDTFVGVIVALLAIIVTVAIAWQIYNAVDMKTKVEELKQLEDRIKKQEKSLEQFKLETTRDLCAVVTTFARVAEAFPGAYVFILDALDAEMQLEKPDQYDELLDMMESLNEANEESVEIETKKLDGIIEKDKELRSYSNYRFIKRRYEPLYEEFMSKVKKDEN